MSATMTAGDDIQVWRICSVLSSCPSAAIIFSEKVYDLARSLRASNEFIRNMGTRINLKLVSFRTALQEILQDWVTRDPSGATLENLLSALADVNLMDAARSLRMTFPHDSSPSRKIFLKSFPEKVPQRNTIPSRLFFYIPRLIVSKSIISKRLFASKISHVIAVTGIPWHELSLLISHATTMTSSVAIDKKQLVTNFVLLDHESHLEKICKLTTKPVHLLKMEKGKLRWLKSSGNIVPLQQYVEESEHDSFTEDDLCKHVESSGCNAICIVDTPGTGKSVLLAEIGRKLLAANPARNVFFLSVSLLIAEIKRANISDIKVAFRIAVESLTKNTNNNSTASLAHLFNSNITSEPKVELLLDGIDEVHWADTHLVTKVLKTVQTSFKSTRMWITAHPELQQKLERMLNIICYQIRPFSHEDRVRVLATFWCRSATYDITARAKFNVFAEKCLEYFHSRIKPSDRDIAGIPLQCLMAAEIFEEQARNFAMSATIYLPSFPVQINSIADLYENLIKRKLEKFSMLHGKSVADEERLLKTHMQLSVSVLFQEMKFPALPQTSIEEALGVGVLEGWDNKHPPRFIHRTFAEYFVARFIVNQLVRMGGWTDNHTNFLFSDALAFRSTQGHFLWQFCSVIPYFINSLLPDASAIPHYTIQACCKELYSRKIFQQLTHSAAYSNSAKLFQFLLRLCAENGQLELHLILNTQFLKTLICGGSVELFRIMDAQYFGRYGFDIYILVELLGVAVEMGEYAIVEYIINERGLRKHLDSSLLFTIHDALYFCLINSNKDSEAVVRKKLQIIGLFLAVDSSIVREVVVIGKAVFSQDNVHPRLLQEVVNIGSAIAREI